MPVSIELSRVTYCGNEPGPGEVIRRGVFEAPELPDFGFAVREDVVVREKMYLASMQENITRKRSGCGEKTNTGRLIIREKFLDVTNLQIWDQICAEDFGRTVWELARKKGYSINDLQDTAIQQELITIFYQSIWKRDLLTIAQFGDTATDVTPPAGDPSTWTPAAAADYNYRATIATMDGFWKLVFQGVALKTADASDPDGIIRALTIPAVLPQDYTRDVLLPALYNGQSELMDQVDESEKRFVLSRSLYNNFVDSMTRTPAIPAAYEKLQTSGATEMWAYHGIKIIKNKMIEQKVKTLKNRAYLIVDGGFEVGTDTYQESQVMKQWFSEDTDLNNVQIRYKLGEQYVDGDVVIVAY